MITAEKPVDEAERLATLRHYEILDTPPEQGFDDLVMVAATLCRMPIATVTLVDQHRQWFKAKLGLEVTETSRDVAFCAHAILYPERTMVVNDARQDVRFADNPLVTDDPGIHFYAGVPLKGTDGQPVGTICVMDRQPGELGPEQLAALEALARQASVLMELRSAGRDLSQQLRERAWYERRLLDYQAQLEMQNADLAELTKTDPLTGLSNRRAFSTALTQALEAATASGKPLHIAMMDIDHFKTINDLHGHAEGDRVLQALAQVLQAQHSARGHVARYGGEEFVILLADAEEIQARLQAEFMREAIAALPLGLPVTVSIGLAAYRPEDDADSLIVRADAALYEAKRLGRDQVVVAA